MSASIFCRSISIVLRSIFATFLLVGAVFVAEPVTADPVDFQISEQPLNSALNEFARQSDRGIFYASGVVDGIYANGVDGKYEPEDALELLLGDSGLEYSVTASDTFLVNDQRGDSDSKNLSPAPILIAQNQTSPASTSSQTNEGGSGIVTGKVTDARTGANLKGADLARGYLEFADFTDADLTGANLMRVEAAGADFSGADMTGVNLRKADIQGASFVGASGVDSIVDLDTAKNRGSARFD